MKGHHMQENWILIGRYIAVIVASLLLGLALSSMELFENTAVASNKLSASDIVRFLGYGGALVVFWLMVQRLTMILAQQGGRWGTLQHVLLPLGTLIVVSAAYSVLLPVLAPLMSANMKQFYNWVFILATIAAAVWLIVAMFNQSSSVTEMLIGHLKDKGNARPCGQCNTANPPSAQFCAQCGQAL